RLVPRADRYAVPRRPLLALLQSLLDSRVGNQPQQRGEQIQCAGEPGAHKCERDCGEVERKRDFGFPFFANSQREKRFAALFGDDGALENMASSLAGSVLLAFSSRVCRSPGIFGKVLSGAINNGRAIIGFASSCFGFYLVGT